MFNPTLPRGPGPRGNVLLRASTILGPERPDSSGWQDCGAEVIERSRANTMEFRIMRGVHRIQTPLRRGSPLVLRSDRTRVVRHATRPGLRAIHGGSPLPRDSGIAVIVLHPPDRRDASPRSLLDVARPHSEGPTPDAPGA